MQLDPAPKAAAPAPAAQPQIMVGGKKISKETADAIEQGNAAMSAKNWSAARESYLKALPELPDNGPLLQRIAAAYLAEGKRRMRSRTRGRPPRRILRTPRPGG